MTSIAERVRGLIARRLKRPEDEIGDDKQLGADLGADSLALVDIVMDVEDAFGIEIPDAESERLVSALDISGYVERQLASRG